MEQTNRVQDMLLEIYCDVDDFSKAYTEYWRAHLVTDGREILPQCAMMLSEIIDLSWNLIAACFRTGLF